MNEQEHFQKPYPEPTGIKSWAEEDRPREKLFSKGKHTLSESELIAILLRSGTREKTAVDVAKEIMKKVNHDLNELSKLTVKDIMHLGVKGIGETKAITIVAALELGRRRQSSEAKDKPRLISSRDAFELLHPLLADKTFEEFWIVLLNRSKKVLDIINISTGGITGTTADTRIIFNHALQAKATSILLCHNHPSGNIKPSEADISLTKKMKEGGKLLEIDVDDHIIIGAGKYFSFADEGLL